MRCVRVVYVDELLFLNFTVDYFLLWLTAKLGGRAAKRKRLALGAAVGAISAGILFFIPLQKGSSLLAQAAVCAAVTAAVFSPVSKRAFFRLAGLFVLLSAVSAGAVMGLSFAGTQQIQMKNGSIYFEIPISVMVIAFAAVYLLSGWTLGKGRAEIHRTLRTLSVQHRGNSVTFSVLYDSGNLLRDPISGKRVILLSGECALEALCLTGEMLEQLRRLSPEQMLPCLQQWTDTAFWLVPMETAEGSGLLTAFRPEKLWLEGKETEDFILGIAWKLNEFSGDCCGIVGA